MTRPVHLLDLLPEHLTPDQAEACLHLLLGIQEALWTEIDRVILPLQALAGRLDGDAEPEPPSADHDDVSF